MNLKTEILKKRNIKENSLKAYLIALKKLNNNKEVDSLDFLKNKEDIIEKVKSKALTTQRNYLSAILVALGTLENDNDELMLFYKKKLENTNKEYSDGIATHKKSESQSTNWVTLDELSAVRDRYQKKIRNENFHSKDKLTSSEFNYLTNYLIVALYTFLPPVRLDFAPMKIVKSESDDNDKDNFLVNKSRNKKLFIINEYKSSKSYGKLKIPIPPKLNSVINLYLKFHDNDSFLLNSRGGDLTANGLSKLITSSFGRYIDKNITLNLLRHVYISENVEIKEETKEAKLAKQMGHSIDMQQNYIKK